MSPITPAPFDARTRVHEYGGGAFTDLNVNPRRERKSSDDGNEIAYYGSERE